MLFKSFGKVNMQFVISIVQNRNLFIGAKQMSLMQISDIITSM